MTQQTPAQHPEQTVYDQIGAEGFARLIDAFYRRVATDSVLRLMYPEDDLAPAARRLCLFLEQFFGGPRTYSADIRVYGCGIRHS